MSTRIRPWHLLGIVPLSAAAAVWWIKRTYVAVNVVGNSMEPTLRPGARVIVRRGAGRLRTDDLVVIAEPDPISGWPASGRPAPRGLDESPWNIKRAVGMPGDPMPAGSSQQGPVPPGHIAVKGDGRFSSDSRHFGPCPRDQILGRVVRVLRTGAPTA
ncbi:S26 family signal peptidase [Streptomyces tanashiensis]|uniref:S26 family signal peptidase n=1 Tax=Streptomyces tanashiensis TaxID=67367 RepID=A0ABY6QVU3_9ACTN|nr:S26 family signal peptidase [Streptomyces tanashiensis]UZX21898.1 S26 family signal peptidase [Streptomyces tanashiensis]GGY03529.1 S26 family signal peptidase [Streptomyces tanashiensis]